MLLPFITLAARARFEALTALLNLRRHHLPWTETGRPTSSSVPRWIYALKFMEAVLEEAPG